MAAYSKYPYEMHHPNGFKVLIAFDVDDERLLQAEFAEYRKAQQAAMLAGMRRETIGETPANNTLTMGGKR